MKEEYISQEELIKRLDKTLRENSVEYETPKENGEIGTILGVPTFISKSPPTP